MENADAAIRSRLPRSITFFRSSPRRSEMLSMSFTGYYLVEKHDLLVRRVPGERVSVQPETLERVVEQGLADCGAGLASLHAVVERHPFLLRIRQPRVRTDFQRDVRVPVGILAAVRVTGAAVPDAEDARQQEVLETVIGEAVRPGMPAEAVEGNGMRCDPAPARGRAGKRLVFDFDGLPVVDGLEHGAQVAGIDAPSGAAHRIEVRH